MAAHQIDKTVPIEDLVKEIPQSVTYLMEEGIRCLICGEPIWGTLESAAKEKGFTDADVSRFVDEINQLSE